MCGSYLGPYGGWCPTGQRLTCGRETHQSFKKISENTASCTAATIQLSCMRDPSCTPRNSPLKDPLNAQQIEKMRASSKPQAAETLGLLSASGTIPGWAQPPWCGAGGGGRREGEGTAQVLQKRNTILNQVESSCLHPTGWNFLDSPALPELTPEQRNWDKDCARRTW